jgi:hypothetical protein
LDLGAVAAWLWEKLDCLWDYLVEGVQDHLSTRYVLYYIYIEGERERERERKREREYV